MRSGTPLQVLKQAEEAEKLYQDQMNELMGTGGTGGTGEIGSTAEPVGSTAQPPEEVVEETADQKAEKAQHKYDVLKGKYDKELPDLALRLAEQVSVNKSLQDRMAALEAGVTRKPEEKPTEKKGLLDSLADDPSIGYLKQEYPEVYKGLATALEKAVETATKRVDDLTKEVAEQKKHVEKSDKDKFYDALDEIEGWETTNKSPEFNAWLDEREPLTGFQRRAILADAHATMDATRAKSFFEEFSKTKTASTEKLDTHKKEETSIAPKTTGGRKPADPGDKTKNYIRASDVKKAYDDKLKGRYNGRDAEWAAVEAEVNKATIEGRILVNQ